MKSLRSNMVWLNLPNMPTPVKVLFSGYLLVIGLGLAMALCAGVVKAADPDTVSREGWRVQVDTNASTTVTLYTASKAGSLLAGKVGGTNAVWVAVATGTNGWVKIAQAP